MKGYNMKNIWNNLDSSAKATIATVLFFVVAYLLTIAPWWVLQTATILFLIYIVYFFFHMIFDIRRKIKEWDEEGK
jgi:membrane protein YdbS with pleckstrin-like domain